MLLAEASSQSHPILSACSSLHVVDQLRADLPVVWKCRAPLSHWACWKPKQEVWKWLNKCVREKGENVELPEQLGDGAVASRAAAAPVVVLSQARNIHSNALAAGLERACHASNVQFLNLPPLDAGPLVPVTFQQFESRLRDGAHADRLLLARLLVTMFHATHEGGVRGPHGSQFAFLRTVAALRKAAPRALLVVITCGAVWYHLQLQLPQLGRSQLAGGFVVPTADSVGSEEMKLLAPWLRDIAMGMDGEMDFLHPLPLLQQSARRHMCLDAAVADVLTRCNFHYVSADGVATPLITQHDVVAAMVDSNSNLDVKVADADADADADRINDQSDAAADPVALPASASMLKKRKASDSNVANNKRAKADDSHSAGASKPLKTQIGVLQWQGSLYAFALRGPASSPEHFKNVMDYIEKRYAQYTRKHPELHGVKPHTFASVADMRQVLLHNNHQQLWGINERHIARKIFRIVQQDEEEFISDIKQRYE